MSTQELTHTLVESFNTLADEVQNLSDRQTVLEHKLRYAHEQVCPTAFHPYDSLGLPPATPRPSSTLTDLVLLSSIVPVRCRQICPGCSRDSRDLGQATDPPRASQPIPSNYKLRSPAAT